MRPGTDHLDATGPDKTSHGQILCLALCHNERNLLEPFLSHYRALGDVAFLFVDDRSDDGSSEVLRAQPDVTMFVPKDGSTYAEHKREWRGQLLDLLAQDRWILAPDLDELLVWHGAPHRSLTALTRSLDDEGAQGLYGIMLDMYADKPLKDHVYDGGPLADAFPYFDDPRKDPAHMWMERGPGRYLQRWPCPHLLVLGGMRHRMVTSLDPNATEKPQRRRLFGKLRDHRRGDGHVRRLMTKSKAKQQPLNLTKVPLVKWQQGMRFYGGAHAVNRRIKLSRERGALLHFPVTRGLSGLESVIKRGQHADQASHYRNLLRVANANPVYDGSSHYTSPEDLRGILLGPEGP